MPRPKYQDRFTVSCYLELLSLSDAAMKADCSKSYVYNQCKAAGIRLRRPGRIGNPDRESSALRRQRIPRAS